MPQLKSQIFALAGFALIVFAGCEQSTTRISKGMNMQDAVAAMSEQGLEPQQMAYSGAHNAFDLTDGRTIVLIGEETVNDIQIVKNPDDPKSQREIESVGVFDF